LVHLLKGEIAVDSEIGVGTRFVLTLPKSPSSVGDAKLEKR
jgi:signal transduction histidine kinase